MRKAPGTASEDLTCIWVLAGVLSYRLCDRHYECEGCELFHALRGEAPGAGSETATGREDLARDLDLERTINSYVCHLTAGCTLHLDRYYCRSHLWLDRQSTDRVVIGLDGHILRVLYPVSEIVPPPRGAWVRRGEPCGRIRRARMSVPVSAPLSGEVESLNDSLIETLAGRGALDGRDDWLMTLRSTEDPREAANLGRGERALSWYLRNIQLLKSHLRETLAVESSGLDTPLLNDGGQFNLDVEQVMGSERYERLVEALFELQI